jgi:hypothetical protein
MIPRFSYECNRVLSQKHPDSRHKTDYVRISDLVALLERLKGDNEGLDSVAMKARFDLIKEISEYIGEPFARQISSKAS